MTSRENLLKAMTFDHPDWVPTIFHVNDSCWAHYDRETLYRLMADRPELFPDLGPFERVAWPEYPEFASADRPFIDPWGCRWETSMSGIIGAVTDHPLADWGAFETYQPPDPEVTTHWSPIDWEEARASRSSVGFFTELNSADIGHGHTFLKLIDIRGYEAAILDMADEEPRLVELLEMITEFNHGLVTRFLERVGVELLGYAEDLGMQVGPMLSPDHFRQYIKPAYREIMQPTRDAGALVHMHSDGDIRTVAEDLLELGVQVLNVQDLVNGIEWLRDHLKGRVCIDLDIDRQHVTVSGSPADVDELLRREVAELGDPAGGLMLIYGLYPGVPLENAAALMDAMIRYRGIA
jgi:uroporphyrinogen decarboxylase